MALLYCIIVIIILLLVEALCVRSRQAWPWSASRVALKQAIRNEKPQELALPLLDRFSVEGFAQPQPLTL